VALPFGYSPTMLLVLAPFCLLPERFAYVLWSAAGVLGTVWIVRRAPGPWIALLGFLTPIVVFLLALGQTALLSTAALFFLMRSSVDRDARSPSVWARAAVLFLLTAKPPLAATAAAALLATGDVAAVCIAAVMTAASMVGASPWLGDSWVTDYVELLRHYDRARLDPAFAWSIVPDSMSNLRAALSPDAGLGDDVALTTSGAIFVCALAALAAGGRACDWEPGRAWRLAVLAYLTCCPHLSPTEDVALVCAVVGLGPARARQRWLLALAALVPIGLLASPAIGPLAGMRPSLLFGVKLAILSGVLVTRALAPHEAPAPPDVPAGLSLGADA
jgi:hypothetical protein